MHFLSDIVQFSYSADELRRCLRPNDLWHFGITKHEIESKIQEYSNAFLSSHCEIARLKVENRGGNSIYTPATVQDALCLRRTNHIIKKALRTPVLNRDDEMKQLLQLLSGETNCNIFRTDIKSYFESVPFAEIISGLQIDGLRNNCALSHLKNLNSLLLSSHNCGGLPRGLALSSTLADYALQGFDRNIFNSDSVVYYTRYVDDICIVHFSESELIQDLVKQNLPFNLQLNAGKTQKLRLPSADNLEFLGYCIQLNQPQSVSISATKIGKTKKRIVLSLKAFMGDKNFDMLLARLRFLACSTRMKKVGRKMLVYTGYRHVYRLCNEEAVSMQLKDLDCFLHGIINSKRFILGRSLKSSLNAQQRQQLRTLSFEKHYASSLTFTLNPKSISVIKQAWQYE